MACTRHHGYPRHRIFKSKKPTAAGELRLSGQPGCSCASSCLSQRRSDLRMILQTLRKRFLLCFVSFSMPTLIFQIYALSAATNLCTPRTDYEGAFDLTVELIRVHFREPCFVTLQKPNIIEIIGKQSQRQLSFLRVLSPPYLARTPVRAVNRTIRVT